jgi:hypothetical protein
VVPRISCEPSTKAQLSARPRLMLPLPSRSTLKACPTREIRSRSESAAAPAARPGSSGAFRRWLLDHMEERPTGCRR